MSVVELCNRALQEIGTRSTMTSIDENSNEAKECKKAFDDIRKKLIRAAPWAFCKASARLALKVARTGTPENPGTPGVWDNSQPPPGWLYAYGVPSDCLRVRYVLSDPAGGTGPYMQPMRFSRGVIKVDDAPVPVIATNVRGALAVYNADIVDDGLWDGDFREAFIAALAATICFPLSGSQVTTKQLIQITNLRIIEAQVADANESGPTRYDAQSDVIRSREAMFETSFGDQFAVP